MKWLQKNKLEQQVGTSKKVKRFAWYPVVVGIKQEGHDRVYTWAWMERYTAVYSYEKLSRNFTGLPKVYYGWVFQYGEPTV